MSEKFKLVFKTNIAFGRYVSIEYRPGNGGFMPIEKVEELSPDDSDDNLANRAEARLAEIVDCLNSCQDFKARPSKTFDEKGKPIK